MEEKFVLNKKALHDKDFTFRAYVSLEVTIQIMYDEIKKAEKDKFLYKSGEYLEKAKFTKELKKLKLQFLTLYKIFNFEEAKKYKLLEESQIEKWKKEINF